MHALRADYVVKEGGEYDMIDALRGDRNLRVFLASMPRNNHACFVRHLLHSLRDRPHCLEALRGAQKQPHV